MTFGRPDYHLHDINASSGCWSQLVFSPPPHLTRSKGSLLPGTPVCEPPPKNREDHFVDGCEVLEKAPVSVVTAPSVNIFKKRLEQVWAELFPHIPHWLNTNHPNHLPPPFPTWTLLISSYHLYMLYNSLFCVCGRCGLLCTIINQDSFPTFENLIFSITEMTYVV